MTIALRSVATIATARHPQEMRGMWARILGSLEVLLGLMVGAPGMLDHCARSPALAGSASDRVEDVVQLDVDGT